MTIAEVVDALLKIAPMHPTSIVAVAKDLTGASDAEIRHYLWGQIGIGKLTLTPALRLERARVV